MLSDREKMVLHFCCTVTIAKMTGVAGKNELMEKMITDIRKNRCRSLSEEDVEKLLDEVNEEMVGGRNMFKFLMEETISDTYPRNEDKWEDLK